MNIRSGLIVACFAAWGISPASAQNFARGQELFEDHCQACHEDFERPEVRHLRSAKELRARIEAWAAHTNTGWKQEDIEDVLFYLDRSFYRFDKKPLKLGADLK